MKQFILFTFVFFSLNSGSIKSQGLDYISSSVSGPVFTIHSTGNRMYAGSGSALEIFDISDIQNPVLISKAHASDCVTSISIKGNSLYAGNNGIGTTIFNIADENHPINTGLIYDNLIPGHQPPVICGNTGFFSYGSYGLKVMDLTDELNPVEITGWQAPDFMLSVMKKGDTLYTTDRSAGLIIFSYQNNTLLALDTVDIPVMSAWHYCSIDSVNNYLWVYGYKNVVPYNDTLVVNLYSIHPSSYLQILSTFKIKSRPAAHLVSKNLTAYIACWEEGVKVVDFSNLLNPVLTKTITSPDYSLWLHFINDSIMGIAEFEKGIRFINTNDTAYPCIYNIDNYGDVRGLAFKNDYIYSAVKSQGISVCRSESNGTLTEISLINGYPSAKDVFSYNDLLFVPADTAGVLVFSTTNITSPAFVKEIKKPIFNGAITSMAVGNLLFVLESYTYFLSRPVILNIWDITNISNPVLLSEITVVTQSFPAGIPDIFMDIKDSILAICCWNDAQAGSLHIVDIANPSAPQLIFSENGIYPGQVKLFEKNGIEYLAFAQGSSLLGVINGMRIYNIVNPALPVPEANYTTGTNGNRCIGIELAGNNAFLAEGGLSAFGTVTSLDISNVSNPTFIESVKIGSNTSHHCLKYNNQFLFHSSGSPGVMSIRADTISGNPLMSFNKMASEFYPNPARDFIRLKNHLTGNINYTIRDINGKIVKSGQSCNERISLKGINNGVYLLYIKGNEEAAFKFVKLTD